MTTKQHCTVRIPRDLRDLVDAQAAHQGCTPSEVIRRAIEHYLTGARIVHESERRHLRVAEYTQVALDAMIRENHPELRDQLVLETDRRMERYHGAR